MEIKETAMVGTLESGDVAITLDPNPGRGIEIELESDVKPQFGTAIERAVREELERFSVAEARVRLVDKGALDCVIKARTLAAAQRALGTVDEPNWEVL